MNNKQHYLNKSHTGKKEISNDDEFELDLLESVSFYNSYRTYTFFNFVFSLQLTKTSKFQVCIFVY